MTISVRLDPETQRVVERLAQATGQTKSAIIRGAIMKIAGQEGLEDKASRPYEALAPWVGCVTGGPPDLSERTGEKFRRLLKRGRTRRR